MFVCILAEQNMLATNRQEWSLRNIDVDLAIRNELTKTLMYKTAESENINLTYSFLMSLVDIQKSVSEPVSKCFPFLYICMLVFFLHVIML